MTSITYQPGMDTWRPREARKSDKWRNPCQNQRHGGSREKADHPSDRGSCELYPDPKMPLHKAFDYGQTRLCINPAHARLRCARPGYSESRVKDCKLGKPELYTPAQLEVGLKLVQSTRRSWKAPRLADEGKPFDPALEEPGSWVTWTEGDVQRTGQVWSATYPEGRKKRVFVVDTDRVAHQVLVDDLRAASPTD